MTPSEVTNILRQFNEWRRGDEDIPQFDLYKVDAAIDAAAEMIEQLEAAESDALEQARMNGMGSEREAALMAKLEAAERERDALRARIKEREKQEPVAWARKIGLDVPSFGCVTDLKYRPSDIPESSYIPLYTNPGAQPAPSVPEGWKLVPIEPT